MRAVLYPDATMSSERPRRLADLGERALIERIERRVEGVANAQAKRRGAGRWRLGIGDDAAIYRPVAGEELVLSTDAQVEDVHFRLGRETPRTVGRRALAVSLSDLAAMGAEPVGVLLDLAAPAKAPVALFDAIVGGFVAETARHRCPLVGGNLSRARRWSLDMTVVGRCARGRALSRRGLRPGDRLCVTGSLGVAALARLRADRAGTRLTRVPTPRLEAGRALARDRRTRACIDLSDGLAQDLSNLLAADGLGARIDPAALPRPRGFDRACRALDRDPLRVLTAGGEDYELLFAFRCERNPDWTALADRLGVAVREIGRVRLEPGVSGLPTPPRGHHF